MPIRDEEVALCGWKEICEQLNHWIPDLSESKILKRYKAELRKCGVIMHVRCHSAPGRYRVYAFPSMLKVWLLKKSAKGAIL